VVAAQAEREEPCGSSHVGGEACYVGTRDLRGHLWTLVPNLRHRARPWRPPPGEAWSTTVQDAKIGAVTLRGALHRATEDRHGES
jgi:hypothetical protein